MPRKPDPNAGQSTELVFPDGLEGTEFRLRENLVYPAEEVRAESGGEVPEFGDWLAVQLKFAGEWTDGWLVALSEIEQWLAAEPEDGTYRVTRAEKTGPKQTDPYEINVELVEEADQGRL